MGSDLLSIGRSGVQVARIALDVTAQNIANASSEGYIRRSTRLAEVSSTGGVGRLGDVSLSGVKLDGVIRNADQFRQSEVRRTGADAARSSAEVSGLENTEAAVEQSGVYDAIVKFEGALQQLVSDPTSDSLRAGVIEDARTLAGTFNVAANALASVGKGLNFEATAGVSQVNTLSAQLAQVNLRLSRASDASSDQTALLDQRDSLLQKLSEYTDVSTSIATDDTVELRVGGSTGPLLVQGGTAQTLAMTTAANGTVAFTIGGSAVTLVSGSLTGKQQALTKLAAIHTNLDTIAKSVIDTMNAAQAAGVNRAGTTGQAMFSGTTASTMALSLSATAGLATAPAGAAANSRDPANLNAMRDALGAADPTGGLDSLIFDISGTVAGRKITRDALQSIANAASLSLQAQAGVDLDQEAVNLVRFQQAFQASGKVMQAAKDIFDTLLAIR